MEPDVKPTLTVPVTREDVIKILISIGAPGEKREEKVAAIKKFSQQNFQGIPLEDSLNSYEEF